MPLLTDVPDEVKSRILQNRGLDPEAYDVDEHGNITPKPTPASPPIMGSGVEPIPQDSNTSVVTKPKGSALGAFAGHAAGSAFPTLAGIGTGALAAEEIPFAHAAPPYSELAAGLIGALGGGYGASKLQGALMPQEAKEGLSSEEEEHPLASKLGDIAPTALAFNPIAGIKGLVSGSVEGDSGILQNIPKLLGANPNALTATEKQALINAGVNTGVQSGLNVANQVGDNKPFDWTSLGLDAATGAIFNEPWGIGRMMPGMGRKEIPKESPAISSQGQSSPMDTTVQINPTAYGARSPEMSNVVSHPRPNKDNNEPGDAMYYYAFTDNPDISTFEGEGGAIPKESPAIISQVQTKPTAYGARSPEMSNVVSRPKPNKASNEPGDAMYYYASTDNPDISTLEGEGGAIPNPYAGEKLIPNRKKDYDLAQKEMERQNFVENAGDLQSIMQGNQITSPTAAEPAFIPNSMGEETSIPKVDYTGNTEQDNREVAQEGPADLAARKAEGLGDKYQDESDVGTTKLSESDPRYLQAVADLAKRRNITLQEAAGLVNPTSGNKARGSMNQSTRVAKINPASATMDTPVHEVAGHGFVDDLENSSKPSDRALAQRGKNIFNGDADAAEEYLASRLGVEGAQRLQASYGTKSDQAKLWFKDFISRWKNTLGMASDQDVINHLARRAITDAPYGTRGEVVYSKLPGDIVQKNQEESEDKNAIQKQSTNEIPLQPAPGDSGKVGEGVSSRAGETITSKEVGKEAEPTPGSVQSLDKYGPEEDNRRTIDAVANGTKPVALMPSAGITNKDIAHIKEMGLIRDGRGFVYKDTPEGNLAYEKIKALDDAFQTGNHNPETFQKEFGRALGYTENEINEFGTPESRRFRKTSPDKGQAARLSELTNKGNNLTPEELAERNALQAKSDSLKGKWKFQDEDEKLGSPTKESTKEPSALPFSSLPGFRSQADVIQAKEGERALPALKGAGGYLDQQARMANDWIGRKNDITKGLSTKEKELIEQKGVKGVQKGIDTTQELPTKLQAPFSALKSLHKEMQEGAIKQDQPLMRNGVPSPRRIDPNYWPQQYDPNKVLQMRSQSAEGQRLRDIQLAYDKSKGMSEDEAQEHLNNILTPNSKLRPDLSHFRALDVEQGVGVPKELQRPGLDRNLERYYNRYAAGRSFHDNIESKPDVAPLFGIKNDPYGKPFEGNNIPEPLQSKEAHSLLSDLRGEHYDPEESNLKATEGIATAAMLGPPTSMHIMFSSLMTALSHTKPGEYFGMIKAGLSDISGALKRSYITGLNRYKPTLMRDFLDAHSTASEKLNSIRDLVSTVNGRESLSKYTNAMVQNMGEYLIKSRLPLADMGDKQSIRLLQQLDPTWHQGKSYSEEEKLNLAAGFARLVHGAHDFRTMPSWMLKDNIIHPFVSLMSWNIAQTNSFFKHVVTPAAREGNFTPLITATLGAGIGGYIIHNMRQELTNKKSPIPSLQELAASSKGVEGNLPLVAYNFAAMASYAGYAGILSTIARDAMDAAYKNPMQGAVFPLDEAISNSGSVIGHSISALANSSPSEYFDIGTKAVGDLLRENVQLARMAASWGDQSGVFGKEREMKKTLNTEEGDLRRFKLAEGMPVTDESDINESNPYFNMARKKFQHEGDIGTAASEVPDLISQAWDQSGGNIEVLRNKLRALKNESYPSMPSPEQTPMTFWKYVEYLKKTQGDDVANQRVQEYFTRNMINKAKSSMIPSF